MGVVIRREEARDYAAVESLVRGAFWDVYRPGCNEHLIVHRGRSDAAFVPELDLVMELDGVLIGHIIYFAPSLNLTAAAACPALSSAP